MKSFIAVSESLLKGRKIAVYRLLISFLFPELSRFKDLKTDRKSGTEIVWSWLKSIKIDKSVTSYDGHLILNNP